MAVQINWDNDQHTVLRMEFIGQWGWEEAYEGSRAGYAMVESVDHSVNVIIDMRKSTGLPLLALTHARNMIGKRHPRTGMTVFLGVNTLFLKLWKSFASAYPQVSHAQEFVFARSLAEAYKFFETTSSPV